MNPESAALPDLVCYRCGEWFTYRVRDRIGDAKHPTYWEVRPFGRSDFHWEQEGAWPTCPIDNFILHAFMITTEDPHAQASGRWNGL